MAARHWTMLDVIKTSTCSSKCLLGSCKDKKTKITQDEHSSLKSVINSKDCILQFVAISKQLKLIGVTWQYLALNWCTLPVSSIGTLIHMKTSPVFQHSWLRAALGSFCPLLQQPEFEMQYFLNADTYLMMTGNKLSMWSVQLHHFYAEFALLKPFIFTTCRILIIQ